MIYKKFSALLTALVAVLGVSVAQGGVYLWTDWNGTSTYPGPLGAGPFVANGTIGAVGVTYTNQQGAAFLQNGTGPDFFANGASGSGGRNDAISPYTSPELANGVDNAPTRLEMIGLDKAGIQKLTFTQAVLNPALAIVSVNNGNVYTFNKDFEILSVSGENGNASGYWGNSTTATKTANLDGTFSLVTAGEFHGTIQFSGLLSDLEWNSSVSEYWNGFTVGISAVPEPMTLVVWSGLTAIGGIVAYRRRIAA